MFERITDHARKAMADARQHALRLRHPAIAPEHLLLGLLAQGNTDADQLLQQVGVDRESLRLALQTTLVPGDTAPAANAALPFTPEAKQVLEAMIETNWYDLAMIAITPAGWYDWDSKSLLAGTPAMVELQPTLQRARDAGIVRVGMKAARYLSSFGGKGLENAFDGHYNEKVMQSGLSPWQRSYAYVLAHGVDVVNSDMQNLAHFKQNLAAVQRSAELFATA